jgi:hypothetical protein
MPASGCSNANIYVVSLVPPIIHVIRSVHKPVDNGVVIENAKNRAGNLAHHVWSYASGAVLTTHVR